MAETPVIQSLIFHRRNTVAVATAGAVGKRCGDISASSDIAASSGLNATGSATHRGLTAALRAAFFSQQLACCDQEFRAMELLSHPRFRSLV